MGEFQSKPCKAGFRPLSTSRCATSIMRKAIPRVRLPDATRFSANAAWSSHGAASSETRKHVRVFLTPSLAIDEKNYSRAESVTATKCLGPNCDSSAHAFAVAQSIGLPPHAVLKYSSRYASSCSRSRIEPDSLRSRHHKGLHQSISRESVLPFVDWFSSYCLTIASPSPD
jgi:hypothetical protein